MKRIIYVTLCVSVGLFSYAQDKRIDITGFEELEGWTYTGGGVIESYEDFPGDFGIPTHEGEVALFINYEFADSYPWTWNQINFVNGAMDLTGMREIHMWVYFEPGAVGDLSMRLDVGGGSLGTQYATAAGEWCELVWKIDRLTSESRLTSISNLGGFLCPGSNGAKGKVWVDEIYALRPANTPDEVESVLIYGFNTEDPDTGAPEGWEAAAGDMPTIGIGDVDPSEGDNYMEIYLGTGWIEIARAIDSKSIFDRWPDVLEISVDARVSADYTGSWVQSDLILHSGANDADGNAIEGAAVTDWDGQGKEIGYSDYRDEWKTLLWEVDMSKHADAFNYPDGWFYISFSANNDSAQAGARIFFDNLRVSVPRITSVSEWSLF